MKKQSILIIPGIFPFPPIDGGKICIYSFIEYFFNTYDLHIFLKISNEKELEFVNEYEKLLDVKIHIVDEIPIVEDFKPNLRDFFLNYGKKIFRKFLLRKPSILKERKDSIYLNYNNNFAPFSEKYITKLNSVLSTYKFDIIQTEYTSTLSLVSLFPRDTKKIFVDIESRNSVMKDYCEVQKINFTYSKYLINNAKLLEYTYMDKYDAILTLNTDDKEQLMNNLLYAKVFCSPFPILDKDIVKEFDEDSFEPCNLVFMGSDNHYPNFDALKWFIFDIFPKISNKKIKLLVTGNWSDYNKKLLSLNNDRIEFIGFIDDLNSILKNSISIVPIRLGGGGLRTKLIYSMANNSPIITTSLAAKGFIGLEENAFIVADSTKEFCDSINNLLVDKDKSKFLIKQGRKLVFNHFSQKSLGELRKRIYNEILDKK